jgi:phosphoribosyl 1,2-cyclic phosphodiesterase
MKVKFWGARGGIPTPMSAAELRDKIKEALMGAVGVDLTNADEVDKYIERLPPYICNIGGGNTTCVELRAGDALFILDAGSGIRSLGNDLFRTEFGKGQGLAHIFISHTHWDHVQGFPFFGPAFVPGNQLRFYSPYPDLEQRFEDQQREVFFPVALSYGRATRTWEVLDPNETIEVAGVKVQCKLLYHPGGAYAYRFTHMDKVVVYATDGEYQRMDQEATQPFVEFFRGADLLIFDAQYSFEQAIDEKRDWGHSTPKMGAELAYRAGVKRLALTHHDPLVTDERLWKAVEEAYSLLIYRSRNSGQNIENLSQVILAREGLTIEV